MKKPIILIFILCGFNTLPAQGTLDTLPPTLQCKSAIDISIGPSIPCLDVQLFAVDFIDTLYDDQSPLQDLRFGIRRKCTGSGFTDNFQINFGIRDVGYRMVEVWAKDAAGNVQVCESAVIISHPFQNCDPGYSWSTSTAQHKALPGVSGSYAVFTCGNDTITDSGFLTQMFHPDAPAIWTNFGSIWTPGDLLTVSAEKNTNPLNGVSGADVVALQKHLLGIEPFHSPYQYLAADVNLSGTVTTFDLVLIRRLILGAIPEFPGGRSWRFVPEDFVFPASGNPLAPLPPEQIVVERHLDTDSQFRFIGVKLGDINFSADPGQ